MEVLSADEVTKLDIPKWCTKQRHEYLDLPYSFYRIGTMGSDNCSFW